MPTGIYDADRLDKISQILPQFSKVAEIGDTALFGLEGDPQFPAKYRGSRPSGTIVAKEQIDDEYKITFDMSTGEQRTVLSSTISPTEVWEYDDASFKKVMEREAEKHARAEQKSLEADAEKDETFRGTSDSDSDVIASLRAELDLERANNKAFQNTIITSMREMANDICKIDTAVGNGNRAEFSSIFRKEYARAVEPKMRGVPSKPASKAASVVSEAASKTSSKGGASQAEYRSSAKKKSGATSNIFSDSDSVSDSDTDIMN